MKRRELLLSDMYVSWESFTPSPRHQTPPCRKVLTKSELAVHTAPSTKQLNSLTFNRR